MPMIETLVRELPRRYRLLNRAPRLALVRAIPESAARGERLEIRKGRIQTMVGGPQLKLAHSGRVHEQRTIGEPHELPMCGRMATLPRGRHARGPLPCGAKEPVHERRFPD